MGGEGSGQTSQGSRDKMQIAKTTCYAFIFLAVASAVLVGLLVYYLAVPECQSGVIDGSTGGQTSRPDDGDEKPKAKVTDVLLPSHLVPEQYKVQLIPFIIPDNYTIRGYVEMTVLCQQSGSSNITVHIADIDIDEDSVSVVNVGSQESLKVVGHDYDKEREFYIINVGEELQSEQKYMVKINFTAKLQPGLKGFYRSEYKDERGVIRTIATTQFQATDARRAFPCYDEPALKAKFEVSLGRTRDMTSISNMPIKEKGVEVLDDPNYVWDHFENSVPMSTYLVAFVVSDFEYELSPPTGNNVRFRIWARRNALDQVEYAKSIGAKMLHFFEEYFDVKYPLPKQDMIAIPDFSAGAMENWGLITYRETALLFKEGVSSSSNKQRIAIVVSHELAHQWFGNLVTPSWWTDLWLNEGFASYVEYLGVEGVQPQFKLLEQFVSLDMQKVMALDSLESSHPISIPVKHPDEIGEIFDRISYSKGASIIRMMDHFLTTETFRRGLTNYLNAFTYKAAEQDDLWHYLTMQAHEDGTLDQELTVKMIMDTWTLQMGLPVVTVDRNYEDNSATLTQKRFLLAKTNSSEDTHNYQWWIPITFTEPNGDFNDTYNRIWMKPDENGKEISGLPHPDTPVIFNIKETGYYRVNYDHKNWQLISNQLKKDHTAIDVINRAQIIDDAFNLAKAGLLSTETALQLTSYMDKEKEYIVWNALLTAMGYIDDMLERTEAYGNFQRYMRRLLKPIYNTVGFEGVEGEPHLDTTLRSYVVAWSCKVEVEECVAKAKASFKEWMETLNPDLEENNKINVDLRRTVYCNAIRHGGEMEWLFAWERYKRSNVGSEKASLLQAMSCTKQVWLLKKYLKMSLNEDSGIRQQDGSMVLSAISSNVIGRDLTFDYLRSHWDKVLEYYGGSSFSMSTVVKSAMKNRNTEFEVEELIEFRDQNKDQLSSGARTANQSIETARNNVQWMKDNYKIVADWLREQNRFGLK